MTHEKTTRRRAPRTTSFDARQAVAYLLTLLLFTQAIIPPALARSAAARPAPAKGADGASASRRAGGGGGNLRGVAGGQTAPQDEPAPQVVNVHEANFGIVLTPLATAFAGHVGVDHHQPTGKVVVSANHPSGQPNNFELIDADGTHRSFSNVGGLVGEIRVAAARDDGQGVSRGGFRPGEVFAGTGVAGRIARIAPDGASVQNPWVTLPEEAGELRGGLYVDRTGVFGGDLIAVTTEGGVWRVSSAGAATRVASLGTRLEGVVTVPDDPALYGPWAGKILAGAKEQGAIYAISAEGQSVAYPLGVSPQDIRVIPAHENFYAVDAEGMKLWGAPAAAFTSMIGDVLVAQESPGTLTRVRWNGTAFEAVEVAQVEGLKQITFSPAGLAEISAVKQTYDAIAVVRHAASVAGGGRVEGALWQLLGESLTLSGNAVITSDLLVPGTPTVSVSGHPTFGGTVVGTGGAQPSGYSVSLSGNASLRHLLTRTDPVQLEPVAAPPAPAGARDVSLSQPNQPTGDFATLRHLSLSGQAGAINVPPGTYGRFTGSGRNTAFVLGVANSAEPSQYNLESLSLSGGSELRLAGPVVLTLKNSASLSGTAVGAAEDPRRVSLRVATGGVSLSGGAVLYAVVRAPQGTVSVSGQGRLRGTAACDRLTLSGGGIIQITENAVPAPPVNRPPDADAGPDQTITLPTDTISLSGTVGDDGLPAGGTLGATWTKVSGPGPVSFGNAASASTTATFDVAGDYVLRLTASDTLLTRKDEVAVKVIPRNQPPNVDAGTAQTIELPNVANLSGVVSDDALPNGSTVSVAWSLVSGPGNVTFANPNLAATSASFSAPGPYTLRLSASDSEFTAAADVLVTVHPENQPPTASAGPDQIISLPGGATLSGAVSDDGWPTGGALTSVWTQVSGPAPVSFADAGAPVTVASFSAPGVYVLRLTASDTRLSAGDEVTVNVLPANLPPDADAGADRTALLGANLLRNAGAESAAVENLIPDWFEAVAGPWARSASGAGGLPFSLEGAAYFQNAGTGAAELRQDVDVSAFASAINGGAQQFEFKAYVRSRAGQPPDSSRVVVEYRDAANANVLASFDSGALAPTGVWALVSDTRAAPAGTGWVRVRLTGDNALAGGGLFDGVSLRALSAASVSLGGVVGDDGLPNGSTVSASWSQLSGPASVAFGDPHAAATTATFGEAGVYVLRLSAHDSEFGDEDEVTVTVAPANQPPAVSAGADLSTSVPRPAALEGSANDDGLPSAISLSVAWSKISGPGEVTFADPHALQTTATFAEAGVYVLRLTVGDTEYAISDEVGVTVDPANAAPVVGAGADQTISLPSVASLGGSVSDDGFPRGASLTTLWSKVSGPGAVVFGDAGAAATTASFSAPGVYVLRLSASDSDLTGEDDLTLTLTAPNQPPVVNAGPGRTLTLPADTASLGGTVGDDGLPLGAQLGTLWSLAGASPALAPDHFGDNFDDDSFDTTKWSFTPHVAGVQLFERNGRLEFKPGTQDGGGLLRSTGYRDVRGRVVTFKLGGYDRAANQYIRFNVRDDGAATSTWADSYGGSVQFYADSFLDQKGRSDGVIVHDNTVPLWLRWRQSGDMYFWDTSTDGVNWTNRVGARQFRPGTTAAYFRFEFNTARNAPVIALDDFLVSNPAWDAVAGPGAVAFADPTSPATSATFGDAGTYRLRLTASDTEFTASGDVTVTVNPANRPPSVNAGKDQTVLTSQTARLAGTVQDEGLPAGSSPTYAWSVVSGPGAVTLSAPNSAVTNATFGAPGFYLLRLTSGDSQLSASDDVLVRAVNTFEGLPGGVFVSGHDSDGHAGGERDGRLIGAARNIVQRAVEYVSYNKPNPRILLVTDLRNPGADNGDPREGLRRSGYTFDVADYGSGQEGALDLHTVNFRNYDVLFVASSYGGWLRQEEHDILNARRADVMEFVNEGGGLVALAQSGGRLAPGSLYPGVTRDHYRFLPIYVNSVQLQQDNTGARLTPEGEALGLTLWDITVNSTENYFTTTGGMDVIELSASGLVTTLAYRGLRVNLDGSSNEAPVVYAGPDRVITLPNGAALAGVASDDALPAGSTLGLQWTVTRGPGNVTFAGPNQAATVATFDAPGDYTLRLTGTDGALASYSETHVTVNPTGQFVVVNAGPDRTIRLPQTTALQATVTDGRVSQTQPLALHWGKVSGPGAVSFTAPNALTTTATFGAAGVYVLRFSAGDSGYTGSDELTVVVRPPFPVFGDDFNDNTHDPAKWLYGPGVTERAQQLQVDVPNTSSLAEFVSAVPVDMTADGAYVRFEIPDYADPSYSNNRIIYWRMQAVEGKWFQWIYKNGSLEFWYNNTFLYRNNFGLHPRHWRIIHFAANDRVHFDTSDNGVNWTTWYSLVGPYSFTLDRLTFRLIVGAQGAGAAGTFKIDNVNTNVPVSPANQPPTPAPGGPYRVTVGQPLQLDGSLSTDPFDIITGYAWDFGDGATASGPSPTHVYNSVGSYTVRLTVTDPEGTTGSTTTSVTVTPPNQAPTVEAGADQTVTLPSTATLNGAANDDGLPEGSSLTTLWSVVSGPGAVTFADAARLATTASFSADGTYVLRLSAGDTELSASDDLTVTVNPAPPNQPPQANAGPDQVVTPGLNLVRNYGGEEPAAAGGELPGWTEFEGDWAQAPAGTGGFYQSEEGDTYFHASGSATAELRQDVDVSAFAGTIANGAQQFELSAQVRSGGETPADSARVVFEFRDAANERQLGSADSGLITTSGGWHTVEGTANAPPGTGWIRVHLIAARHSGATTDAYFDSVSVRAAQGVGLKLVGAATDDGLPNGQPVAAHWSVVSGPGAVTFENADAPQTSAVFGAPGVYVLKLSATDGQLTHEDEMSVTVSGVNQPPSVNAGADQNVTLPSTATLNGTVNDDGLPSGRSLSASWKKVSGPGAVAFENASAAATAATFGEPGTYLLRLSASDTDASASDLVVVKVNPAPVNQAPSVEAGPDRTASVSTPITLSGAATDDGLPEGASLGYAWSKVSGPGAVTFASPGALQTTAAFDAEGVYTLRLTVGDTARTASDELTVTVNPAGTNHPPTVSAGPDLEVRRPDSAVLNGSVSDDGLPEGSATTVAWSVASGPGAVTFANANSAQTTASFNAAGTYVLRLSAGDPELSASDEAIVNVFDPVTGAPPEVSFGSLTDGEEITAPKDITGTVSGGAWRLEYAPAAEQSAPAQQWQTFASGTMPVAGGLLGRFDPTALLNGTYDIRLVSTDSAGQTTATTASVVVSRNLKVGHFQISFTDVSVPVAGLPVEVTRSYDSRDKRAGDFGFGWTLGITSARVQKSVPVGAHWYETESFASLRTYCLESTRPQLITVTFGDGRVFKFRAVPAKKCQRFQPFSTVQMTFVPEPGTRGTLAPLDGGPILVAGSVPGPVEFVDLQDPSAYYFNPTRFRLTTEDGTSFVLSQQAGVESVSTPAGESLSITRDGITHSSGQSLTFVRDAQGRVAEIRDPSGRSRHYRYDQNGDLETFKDAEGNTTRFTYEAGHYLTKMEVTSADGTSTRQILTNVYAGGRLVRQFDADNREIEFQHDLTNRRSVVRDRLGHPTVYEYDERGNVVYQKDAEGGETRRTFDERDNELTVTTAEGTTRNKYDAADNLVETTDPYNNVTKYTYNAMKRVTSVTDPRNNVTTSTYDERSGNLLKTVDAVGTETVYYYQPLGSNLSATVTTTKDDPSHPRITNFHYDNRGYLMRETNPARQETTYAVGASGNREAQSVVRTKADGTQETLTIAFEYDKENRVVKTTYPGGKFTTVKYNELGKEASSKDQLGRETRFEYDTQGRLVRTVYPDNEDELAGYDEEGRRTSSTDRAGRTTTYKYDKVGRLVETLFPGGGKTTATYDGVGRVLTQTHWLSETEKRTTTYRYEAEGKNRVVYVTDALSRTTKQVFDEAGNLSRVTDAKGRTTRYEYDAMNRRVKVVYHDSTFETTKYDGYGQAVAKTDQASRTTRFEYDAMSRLLKVINAEEKETVYSYDEVGNQVSQRDANLHTTAYEYDALGRRTKRTLPEGMFESYSYDDVGNLKSRTDFNGKTTAYEYDEHLNRLLKKTPDPSLGQPAVSFTYTLTGRRETMADASGVTTYTYDERDRLEGRQTPHGALAYTYDKLGNLRTVRSSNANGVSVDYAYDELSRLKTATDNRLAGDNVTTYAYDEVGNLESYTYGNGVTHAYTYNDLHRLTNLTVSKAASALGGYTYTLGAAGNREAVTEASGRRVTYTYDALYRLTGETVTGDAQGVNGAVGYTHDDAGNRLTRTSTLPGVAPQTLAYDKNDRLAGDTYDANGNTKQSQGNAYAYDFENRLSSVNGGSVTYAYDGDGNRVSKTVGGATTAYLVDTNSPTGYAQVVEELQGGAVVRQYTYGTDLVSQRQLIGGEWAVSFYGYDGHGSVRHLTDTTGAVTDTYTFDAFGNLIARTGTTPNEYLYAGERLDASVGFYYLRARYMNPASGMFLTMDSYEGSPFDPPTLHKYLYAGADPVNRIDPTGHLFDNFSLGATTSIIKTIAGISVPILKKVLVAVAATLLATGSVLLPVTELEQAKAQARVKLKARIEEEGKARGKQILYHYTSFANAQEISRRGEIIASATFYAPPYAFPSGAYATDIPPWSTEYTQTRLSALFYGGFEGRPVGAFVAIAGDDFFKLNYAPYPHQFVRPERAGVPVPVEVITFGTNLMRR